MKILVINAGSSSIKYQLLDMQNESVLAKGLVEKIGLTDSVLTQKANGEKLVINQSIKDHSQGMELVLKALLDEKYGVIKSLSEIDAFGHRVLHGGEKYKTPVLVTEEVCEDIIKLTPLGPLHMPANLLGIRACQKVMPKTPNVALFDTAFHSTMPNYAYMYALPYECYTNYGVRKYGFHGMSHQFIASEVERLEGRKDLKVISCHIGNGASVCAIKDGKCVDTSMGLTPLQGLIMGTRSGDCDPAVVEFICKNAGKTVEEVNTILNKKSGLLGVSGISSDMRDVESAAEKGDERAKLVLDMYFYRIKQYIGSYAATLNGVDVIVFTAGCGENDDFMREKVMQNLDYLGVEFDKEANKNFTRGEICLISKPTSRVKVYVIPTNEELVIARETAKLTKDLVK